MRLHAHPQSQLPAPDALWSLPPAARLLFEAHACTHRLRRRVAFRSMHTTTRRNRIAATLPDLPARVLFLSEPFLCQLKGRALVFVYCAVWRRVRWGGELACLHLRAGPGFPCALVLCLCRLVPQDVLGVFFCNSVLLIERLTMANTCVGPVPCIRQQCTHVP